MSIHTQQVIAQWLCVIMCLWSLIVDILNWIWWRLIYWPIRRRWWRIKWWWAGVKYGDNNGYRRLINGSWLKVYWNMKPQPLSMIIRKDSGGFVIVRKRWRIVI